MHTGYCCLLETRFVPPRTCEYKSRGTLGVGSVSNPTQLVHAVHKALAYIVSFCICMCMCPCCMHETHMCMRADTCGACRYSQIEPLHARWQAYADGIMRSYGMRSNTSNTSVTSLQGAAGSSSTPGPGPGAVRALLALDLRGASVRVTACRCVLGLHAMKLQMWAFPCGLRNEVQCGRVSA